MTARHPARAERAKLENLRAHAPTLAERLTALVDAADAVIAAWESGDLAGAVQWLDADADHARAALRAAGVIE